jgi:hypothetical protein
MALVIAGRIVALDRAHEDDVFNGRVWLGDEGLIDTVTKEPPRPQGRSCLRSLRCHWARASTDIGHFDIVDMCDPLP